MLEPSWFHLCKSFVGIDTPTFVPPADAPSLEVVPASEPHPTNKDATTATLNTALSNFFFIFEIPPFLNIYFSTKGNDLLPCYIYQYSTRQIVNVCELL